MATRNSARSGYWSDTGTWGAAIPTSGDTVNITHAVTYDINDDTNPINTINVNTSGTLQWTGNSSWQALRVSTLINQNGGTISGSSGTQIRIHEGGGWTVQNTAGSNLIMIGSEANSVTALSSGVSTGNGYIDVVNASGFGSGDYISVFDYTGVATDNRTDEVFQVHSVQSNRIYVRRMIGPTIILSQDMSSGTNLIYSSGDVRCLRLNSKIVLGNEVFSVSGLNASNNTITTIENSSDTYASGILAYETGAETPHAAGHKVYKLCTIIISAISGNNYIDVGCAGGFLINDELGLGGCLYANIESKTIQSISIGGGAGGCDRITFSSNLTKNHSAGGLVVKLNRDCVFIGSATNVISNTNGYIYVITGTAASTFNLQNFEMRYVGNFTTTFYGGYVNRSTYVSTTAKKHIGCVTRHAAKTSINGLFGLYNGYYHVLKNCVAFDTCYGLGSYSSSGYSYFSGGISIGTAVAGVSGYFFSGDGFEYFFIEAHNSYGFFAVGVPHITSIYKNYFAMPRYVYINYCVIPFAADESGNGGFICNKLVANNNPYNRILFTTGEVQTGIIVNNVFSDDTWKTGSLAAQSSFTSDSFSLLNQVSFVNNYQGIPGNKMAFYYYGYGETDRVIKFSSDSSWKFYPTRNNLDSVIGFFALCRGSYGKRLSIRGRVRKNSSFNGTGPFIYIRDKTFTEVASVVMPNKNDEWIELKLDYICPDEEYRMILFGGYGSAGNFWIDSPQIYSEDFYIATQIFENEWQRKNFSYDGYSVVLGGAIL